MSRDVTGSGRWVLNDAGEPVPCEDLMEWANWIEHHQDERQLGWTVVGKTTVSTIFLGIDYQFSDDGPSILFESATFGGGGSMGGPWRYSTRAEALDGHARIVSALDRGEEP